MEKKRACGRMDPRVLTTAAMLGALSVVIGIFCKNYLNFGNGMFRVTFENFPIIMAGILFGPGVGCSVGLVSDMISYFLSTQSFALSPIVTLGAALVGLVSGVVARYVVKGGGAFRIVLSVSLAHLVGSLLVKTYGIYAYYQLSYGMMLLYRLPIYTVIAVTESFFLAVIFKYKAFQKFMR